MSGALARFGEAAASPPDPLPPSQSPRFADSQASVLLDLLRGLAALLVLLDHWRNFFFVDYPQLENHRLLWSVPYVLAGGGHQAVIVFFLLSGFFVGGSVFRAVEKDRWEWRSYLLRRLVRLWIVLLPALVACFFLDSIGIYLGHAPGLYHGRAVNHMTQDVSQLLSPRLFLGNLVFLQGVRIHTYGSNGALWSVANEFWYYLLFPLGVLALGGRTRLGWRAVYAGLFVAAAWFIRPGILVGFPIWLVGVLLLRIPSPRFSDAMARRARIVAAVLYLPILLYLAKSRAIGPIASDYILTAITFLFLWILLSAAGRHAAHSVSVRASRELARFSYTLYAVHMPLLVFLASLLVHDARWQPTPAHVAIACTVLLGVVAYALAIAFFTEFRTDAVFARLSQWLGIQPPASVLPSNPAADV